MKSLRSDVWTDTDPDRTGTLAWVYEEGFGFEKYAQYVAKIVIVLVMLPTVFVIYKWCVFQDIKMARNPNLIKEHAVVL
mgnify:CR=1 FL=1